MNNLKIIQKPRKKFEKSKKRITIHPLFFLNFGYIMRCGIQCQNRTEHSLVSPVISLCFHNWASPVVYS